MKKFLLGLCLFVGIAVNAQQTLGGEIIFTQAIVRQQVATTLSTAGSHTLTASDVAGGLIIAATNTATTTMTLPSTVSLANVFHATPGTVVDFYVLNNGASNGTVTVAVGTGMTASGFPSSNTLTLAGSATVGIAGFRITFLSTTASTLTRIN